MRIPPANVIHGIGPEIYEWMDVPDGYEQVGETSILAYVFSLKDGKFYEWDEGKLKESSCREMLIWHLEQAEDLLWEVEREKRINKPKESKEPKEYHEPTGKLKDMLIKIYGIEKYNEMIDSMNNRKETKEEDIND